MSDATPATADGGRAPVHPHPLRPLLAEHLEETRSQTARITAIEGAVDAHTRDVPTARGRLRRRLALAAACALLVTAAALNPDRAAHQSEAFAELVARGGERVLTARKMADTVGWRQDGFRLLAIDRLNLGVASVGIIDERIVTVGIWGQVVVFDP